jgi:hypothetical protein
MRFEIGSRVKLKGKLKDIVGCSCSQCDMFRRSGGIVVSRGIDEDLGEMYEVKVDGKMLWGAFSAEYLESFRDWREV